MIEFNQSGNAFLEIAEISLLGRYKAYRFFSEDNNYIDLFRATVSIND
jgi:hypothetical protein